MSAATPLPHPCLVADIGGTNARFALVVEPGAAPSPMVRLPTGAHGDFADTVHDAIRHGGFPAPRSLLAAVAGPVVDRTAELTNAATPDGALRIDGPGLAVRLALDQGLLFNDFEALSLATPFLGPDAVLRIGGGDAVAGGAVVVVGPGTGLGVGALLSVDGRLLAVASEGGHVGLGPETPMDHAVWPHLGAGRIAAEDLLSGRGLLRLHRALAARDGGEAALAAPAEVVEAALSGAHSGAREAARMFLGLLGRFAGDMALTFNASGGVFIGGGMTPRLRSLIGESDFRAMFEAKAQASRHVRRIPTTLILADDAALAGLAAVAAQPQRFLLDYGARAWRGGPSRGG
jgi:glucokinase